MSRFAVINPPTTEGVEEILQAASGKRARAEPSAAGKPRKKRAPKPTLNPRPYRVGPVRGPGGRFVSGLSAAYTPEGQIVAGGVSEKGRLRIIRAQRAQVLAALREARARKLRDGTIKKLKEASRQLLTRSKLTRGL